MKKRIAFISEHASPLAALGGTDSGGQNVYVGELAAQLAAKGYKIDIYTRREDQEVAHKVPYCPNVRVIHVDAGPAERIPKEDILPYMSEFARNVRKFMDTEDLSYELVHANFFMSGMVAMRLKEWMDIPFAITFHALGHVRRQHQKERDRFPAERLQIEEELVREADVIIAECPQDKDDLISYYRADARKISIIPCGFNPEEFFPIDKKLSRTALGLADDDKVLLQLGRMVPRKGVDNVIEALALLPEHLSDVKLLVVGGESSGKDQGSDAEIVRLKALATKLGVAARVVFTGRKDREQLKIYYDAADIFITTPWYEPFGITPLEAMACGTPVIGAAVGGIKYSVADGETGYLVPPKSPSELAKKITGLLQDRQLLERFSKNALKHVHANFTWEKVAEQVRQLYVAISEEQERKLSATHKLIDEAFEDAARTFRKSASALNDQVAKAAKCMSAALKRGNKILVCGNGGSAAESQHFSAELLGRFEIPERRGLPAIALTADTAMLTAWSNDFGFSDVFARQVQAYGQAGDVLLCLSTSGASPNIIKALQTAKDMDICCITMLGKDGGEAAMYGDINLIVPSQSSQRIQEVHLHLVHVLCGLIEQRLFIPEQSRTDFSRGQAYAPLNFDGQEQFSYAGIHGRYTQRYGS
ncbi:glycosyltransferase [Pedobacter deserti]|uniref:glycosyltransferase n=1 Tax=Pedobacter deserti TaxID=2817382 RepID=UPI002109D8ED|nr:glycosyltransferase [Pedobacter sp. SYSU D00382]